MREIRVYEDSQVGFAASSVAVSIDTEGWPRLYVSIVDGDRTLAGATVNPRALLSAVVDLVKDRT